MASVVGDDDHKRFLIEVYEQISVSNIRQIFYMKRKRKKQEFYFLLRERKLLHYRVINITCVSILRRYFYHLIRIPEVN